MPFPVSSQRSHQSQPEGWCWCRRSQQTPVSCTCYEAWRTEIIKTKTSKNEKKNIKPLRCEQMNNLFTCEINAFKIWKVWWCYLCLKNVANGNSLCWNACSPTKENNDLPKSVDFVSALFFLATSLNLWYHILPAVCHVKWKSRDIFIAWPTETIFKWNKKSQQ